MIRLVSYLRIWATLTWKVHWLRPWRDDDSPVGWYWPGTPKQHLDAETRYWAHRGRYYDPERFQVSLKNRDS